MEIAPATRPLRRSLRNAERKKRALSTLSVSECNALKFITHSEKSPREKPGKATAPGAPRTKRARAQGKTIRASKRFKPALEIISTDSLQIILEFAAGSFQDIQSMSLVCKSWNMAVTREKRNVRLVYLALPPDLLARVLCFKLSHPRSSLEVSQAYRTEILGPNELPTMLSNPDFDFYMTVLRETFMYISTFIRKCLPKRDHDTRERSNHYSRQAMYTTYNTFLRNHSTTPNEQARMLCNWACGGEASDSPAFFDLVSNNITELPILSDLLHCVFDYLRDLIPRLDGS